jgi:hypothetical protein
VNVAGNKLTILRGEMKVVEHEGVKIATIGVLCSNHVWYDITATTADEVQATVENIPTHVAPCKIIENGRLVIMKNGMKYSATGVKF